MAIIAGPARSARGRLIFVVALYCAWLSAGHIPWVVAYWGAKSPSDLTRDYVAAVVLARGERLSTLDGPRGNAEAVRLGAEPVNINENSPFHLHPPPASVPMRLLAPLGFRALSVLWLGLSIALLGLLAHLLLAALTALGGPAPVSRTLLFVLLVCWGPTLTNLELGQWSIVLATLGALGVRAWDENRRGRAAAWLATAAALKLTPAIVLPFIGLRDRRAGAVFVGVLGGALLLALPLGGGLDAWMAFERDAATNVLHWQTWWHNTLSLNGFLARLFIGAHFARPLVRAPALAKLLLLAGAAGLGLVAWVETRARGAHDDGARDKARDGCVLAQWTILIVVLNPLAWAHYALLLLMPAVLVLRVAEQPRSPLPALLRRRLKIAVACALVVLTIPKEALYLLAQPLPTSPVWAPVLSCHLFAALLLFAAATAASRALRRGAPGEPRDPRAAPPETFTS